MAFIRPKNEICANEVLKAIRLKSNLFVLTLGTVNAYSNFDAERSAKLY